LKSAGKLRRDNVPPRIGVAELKRRLAEAEETLRAIRNGEVDAVVVTGQNGDQVFTLDGAGHAYRTLIESMNEGALTLTMDATILYANSCLAKMVGYPLEQVIGSSFRRFLSAEDWTALAPLIQQTENAGIQFQTTLVRGDGGKLPAQLSLRPLVNGATLGMVVTDMTEAHRIAHRKETERLYAQVVAHAVELERRVEERTAELLSANQELESFEASVSHDLRGPLRHLIGYSELVLCDHAVAISEDALRYIKKIRDGAWKMEGMIEALLKFSRVGKGGLSRVPVDIRLMWHDVLTEMMPDLGGRNIEVTIGQLPRCYGDPVLLRQVLVNLLANAIKYSRTRERAIIDISFIVNSDGVGATYVIKDNGIGFDMQHADKLFAVFQRLPNARNFDGTGVGLTTVQRIVQRHGGRIWAESAPERGATFFFLLGEPDASDAFEPNADAVDARG
jgi:PAS domain S-box-containing protein